MLIVGRMIGMQVSVGISFTGSIKVIEYDIVCAQVVCVSDESPVIRKVIVRGYGYCRIC